MTGSGGIAEFDGSVLAITQQIVVVTINYRLGILGGLFTGNEIHGNFQILDQRAAMKFVSETISSFGGDPLKITISGQLAGAFSVATHLTTPKSWPYFAAILQSDPFSLITSNATMALGLGAKVLEALNCSSEKEKELRCLQSVSVGAIIDVQRSTNFPLTTGSALSSQMPWSPVVDGNEHPFIALANGPFARVPVLIGGMSRCRLFMICFLAF